MSARRMGAMLAAAAVLAACAGGEHRPDDARADSVRTPQPTLADPGATSGATGGATAGATSAPVPADSVANTSRGPSGPTPLPMPPTPPPADTARRGPTASRQADGDTLRGIVAVVGSEPMTEVVLRAPRGTVRLAGAALAELRRLSGVEVTVRGRPTGGPRSTFEVSRYAVRAVDGVPARDGTLVMESGAYLLAAADGTRLPLVDPPPALRAQVGARVWVAGRDAGRVASFGVIRPRG